jgi:hypothetical protein
VSFLIAIVLQAVRILRRPIDARLKRRHIGPPTVLTGAVLVYLAWDWLRQPTPYAALA